MCHKIRHFQVKVLIAEKHLITTNTLCYIIITERQLTVVVGRAGEEVVPDGVE